MLLQNAPRCRDHSHFTRDDIALDWLERQDDIIQFLVQSSVDHVFYDHNTDSVVMKSPNEHGLMALTMLPHFFDLRDCSVVFVSADRVWQMGRTVVEEIDPADIPYCPEMSQWVYDGEEVTMQIQG